MKPWLRTALSAVLTLSFAVVPAIQAPSATAAVPTGSVKVNKGASLSVVPGRKVVAKFKSTSKMKLSSRRVVELQTSSNGKTWRKVATAKMNSSGKATFATVVAAANIRYRAVAAKFSYRVKGKKKTSAAARTPQVNLKSRWKSVLNENFSGKSLNRSKWDYRLTGSYATNGRKCSAPYPQQVKISGGKVSLSVKKASSARTKAVRKKLRSSKACPNGVYDNAMISTQGKFSMKQGIVAARIKFPKNQGMHGSVWLQSDKGQEIDLVEAFGYGMGVSNYIHVKGKKYPSSYRDGYILKSKTSNKKWWNSYHVFSVEWTRSQFIFRVDGVETRRIKKSTASASYYLVVSLLSSEYETSRIATPVKSKAKGVKAEKLPATMKVDWVRAWKKA